MRNTSALWTQESEEEGSQARFLMSENSLRNPWDMLYSQRTTMSHDYDLGLSFLSHLMNADKSSLAHS